MPAQTTNFTDGSLQQPSPSSLPEPAPNETPPSPPTDSPNAIIVYPMSVVNEAAQTGYFVDPFPVQPFNTRQGASVTQSFVGTSAASLTCTGDIVPNCFTATPLHCDPGSLKSQLQAAGTTIKAYVSKAAYLDGSGAWHMVASASVNKTSASANPWYVLIHLHPTSPSSTTVLPDQWSADAVLVGSLSTYADANYAGKYYNDNGQLYLVYVRHVTKPSAENVLVAQAMESTTVLAPSEPVVLISASRTNGGYNSEYYVWPDPGSYTFKLLETGNITKIAGKYALAYSTGGYNRPDYKIGVAWSDTFLPASGQTYKRALMQDTAGIWGNVGHDEVVYLLQSMEPNWPNYVGTQVIAPGVPSILQGNAGSWFLFFAGYAPDDNPTLTSTGLFDGSHRRPYYVPLNVNVPASATVEATSPYDLDSWLTPVSGTGSAQ